MRYNPSPFNSHHEPTIIAQVNRSIEELVDLRVVRTFSVPFYPKDVFIMLHKHYEEDICSHCSYAASESPEKSTIAAVKSVVRDTMLKLIATSVSVSVSKDMVLELIAAAGARSIDSHSNSPLVGQKRLREETLEPNDRAHMSVLHALSAFMLPRRDVPRDDVFYLTHPQVHLQWHIIH